MSDGNQTPRIFTRCPACGNDTLTVNNGHLLCTWHTCSNPTMIHELGENRTPQTDVARQLMRERDEARRQVDILVRLGAFGCPEIHPCRKSDGCEVCIRAWSLAEARKAVLAFAKTSHRARDLGLVGEKSE